VFSGTGSPESGEREAASPDSGSSSGPEALSEAQEHKLPEMANRPG